MNSLRLAPARVIPLALACLVALIGVAGVARADEEQVHLRYQTFGPCAGQEAFVSDVAARTPRARWVATDEQVRVFEVKVEADPEHGERWSQTAGTLTILDVDGSVATRRVEGDSCEEVLSALALITALAIDPQAKVAPVPAATPHVPETVLTPPSHVPETALTPPPPSAAPTLPAHAGGAPPAAASSPPTASSPPVGPAPFPWSPPPYRAEGRPERWRWAVGVQPAATSALGAPLSFTMAVYLDVALEREHWLAPAFRLAVSLLPTRSFELSEGRAEFLRLAAHPVGCPIRLELIEGVALQPCVGAEIGMLRGSGKLEPERDSTSLWLALAAPLRLQWIPIDWALLEAQGEFGVPLVRQRFFFEPDRTVLSVPPVFGSVGGSFAVRF